MELASFFIPKQFYEWIIFSFNDEGKRTNYSFDVVELSPENGRVKIGTWSDRHRLRITNERNGPFINTLPPRGYSPSGSHNTQWENKRENKCKIKKRK